MPYIDHIKACNQHSPEHFIPFRVNGSAVGLVRHRFAAQVQDLSPSLDLAPDGLNHVTRGDSITQRSRNFAEILQRMLEQGLITHLHGEQYIATAHDRAQGVLLIDRAAAPYFGIRAFGQHINGYVHTGDGMKMWIARRASDRVHFPGCLDNLAAGGLPYDIALMENLIKECWEEASIPRELASRARPVGTLTYCTDTEKGCKPDTLYCYDLELPEDFIPRSNDGEVEAFHLMGLDEVAETVRDSQAFKLNCNLVVIDFLIRHGYLSPEQDDYLELVTGLHPALPSY